MQQTPHSLPRGEDDGMWGGFTQNTNGQAGHFIAVTSRTQLNGFAPNVKPFYIVLQGPNHCSDCSPSCLSLKNKLHKQNMNIWTYSSTYISGASFALWGGEGVWRYRFTKTPTSSGHAAFSEEKGIFLEPFFLWCLSEWCRAVETQRGGRMDQECRMSALSCVTGVWPPWHVPLSNA